MFAVAAALLGLILLLATLQYRWLGRISDAERDSRRSTLTARAAAFASDFDRELTLAYMLFQIDPALDPAAAGDSLATRFGIRYDRWQASARYPKLVREYFVASRGDGGEGQLQRFNPAMRTIEPAEWPSSLTELRDRFARDSAGASDPPRRDRRGTLVVRTVASPLWEDVPALVIPMPMLFFGPPADRGPLPLSPSLSYTVLMLDQDYVVREMLPALAQQHFREVGDGASYDLAVVKASGDGALYRSTPAFDPKPDVKVDATADLFQVRTQEFAQLAADVRRLIGGRAGDSSTMTYLRTLPPSARAEHEAGALVFRELKTAPGADVPAAPRDRAIVASAGGAMARNGAGSKWRLLVKHPSGSLETAVATTRRRNLLISSSILAVLGASVGLLVLSARRAQEVARQQMEFVAAVSHELRTPLAVIRSAGDNLADGVIGDPVHVRKYGELVRSEGRRLSEMVEQILELAGIQSGQRRFAPRPLDIGALVGDVVAGSAALFEKDGIAAHVDVPAALPAVLGDEAALRRVLQNLVGNAIKYGAEGRWIGVSARAHGREIRVVVADRGIGIEPSEQARIFEPFYRAAAVVSAQIQGAGLGLSLVQRIVEAHGGRITVQSAPGQGSEFRVDLPVAGVEPAAGADARAAEAPRYT